MKPNNQNKIKLRFMDVSVELTGKKNLEQRALGLMSYLIQDRLKLQEVMNEMHEYDEYELERKSKKKPIHADVEFLKMYA